MKKGVIIGLVIGVVLILVIVGFFILTNKNNGSNENANSQNGADENQIVDCGKMENPTCFINRMVDCLPVTGTLLATDGVTEIGLTILGIENNKCHYQRKVNNVINQNCYFPIEAMSWDVIDQTFDNDKGLQSLVDESCQAV